MSNLNFNLIFNLQLAKLFFLNSRISCLLTSAHFCLFHILTQIYAWKEINTSGKARTFLGWLTQMMCCACSSRGARYNTFIDPRQFQPNISSMKYIKLNSRDVEMLKINLIK